MSLKDRKILVTGPAGQIAFPLASALACDNEVWGMARFGDPADRKRCDDAGMITRQVDLASGDLSSIPDDFDYVLHLAVFQLPGDDYDHALTVNAEGTGLLMSHCRRARACLVVSSTVVYDCNPDPAWHYTETDPLGDSRQPYARTYAISKIAQEAVARFAAREFSLPTTIARMNVSYSSNGGMPALQADAMLAGQPLPIPPGRRAPFNPIHQDDINAQVPKLLEVAGVPATIVNWAGDDAVEVTTWCDYLGELLGVAPSYVEAADAIPARATNNDRRRALIGDCTVDWREGMRRMVVDRYPDRTIKAG